MYSALQFQLARLAERGFATEDILHGTGLLPRQLEDPWPHLGQEHYSALVRNIQHLSGDAAIGLQLNRELRLSHLGLPGFAALTSPTFGAARKLVMRYRVLKDPAIFPRHQLTRDSWTMTLGPTYPLAADIQRFAIEGHLARTLRYCEELTGNTRAILGIDFSYAAPAHIAIYRELFPCPLRFAQTACRVIFDRAVLGANLPNANGEMHALCERECDLRLGQLEAAESVSGKVYQTIYRNHALKGESLLDLAGVASRLYISPRTLRRKLLAEHTSFQRIVSEVRRDLALYYLTETSLPTKQVAFSLGYSTANNFHRAFKEWTGQRISAVRLWD